MHGSGLPNHSRTSDSPSAVARRGPGTNDNAAALRQEVTAVARQHQRNPCAPPASYSQTPKVSPVRHPRLLAPVTAIMSVPCSPGGQARIATSYSVAYAVPLARPSGTANQIAAVVECITGSPRHSGALISKDH